MPVVIRCYVGNGAKAGFGLLNVRERLRSIGGDIHFQSAPGRGTTVTLVAPAALAKTAPPC